MTWLVTAVSPNSLFELFYAFHNWIMSVVLAVICFEHWAFQPQDWVVGGWEEGKGSEVVW